MSAGEEGPAAAVPETAPGTVRRVARNSAIRAVGYAAGAALFFLSVVLIARYLGVEGFGHYSLIMAVTGVFQLIADMGVRNLLIRDLAVHPERLSEKLGLARSLLLAMSILSVAGLSLIALVIDVPLEVRQSLVLSGFAVMTTLSALGYSAVLRAFERMDEDILGFVAHKVVLLALILALPRTGGGLRGVFVMTLLANSALYLYYRVRVTMLHGHTRLSRDYRAAWRMLVESLPLGLAELLRRVNWQVGRMLLAAFSGPVAVGLFSSAYKFVDAAKPFAQNLTLPLFPLLARQARESPATAFTTYHRGLKVLYVLSWPAVAALVVLCRPLVVLLFGAPFAEAAPALAILAPVAVLLLPASLATYIFTALGRQDAYTRCAGVALVVNVGLDLVLIPGYGFVGAAVAALVAELALFVASSRVLLRLGAGPEIFTDPLKPLLASVGVGAILWLARDHGWPWILAAVLPAIGLYVALLAALRALTPEERALARTLLERRPGTGRRGQRLR